jgi:hypothetical protein
MTRILWVLLSLLLLVSCNESPTGVPANAGETMLVVSETRAVMTLNAWAGNRRSSYRFADHEPWTSRQPTVQFDEAGRAEVQDDVGAVSLDATLTCGTTVNAAHGIELSNLFEIDVLGSAGGSAAGQASLAAIVGAEFDVAIDTMRYELRFNHEGVTNPGDVQTWGAALTLRKVGDAGFVFSEEQSGVASLDQRTLVGTLTPGRYAFFALVSSDSRWNQQGTTPATGTVSLLLSVK